MSVEVPSALLVDPAGVAFTSLLGVVVLADAGGRGAALGLVSTRLALHALALCFGRHDRSSCSR